MEDYILILNDAEYSELLTCFDGKTAYKNLVEFNTNFKKGSYCIEISKPETCVILSMLEDMGAVKMKNLIRNQLISQDSGFFRYYEALKRDLSKTF